VSTASRPRTVPGTDTVLDLPPSIVFVKSERLMNLSGGTAQQLRKRWPDLVRMQRLLVVCDELSMAPGTHKAHFGGPAKGHNGVRDVIKKLDNDKFHRLKIGIGRPANDNIAAWCLSPAMREELANCSEDGVTTKAAWEYIDSIISAEVASEPAPAKTDLTPKAEQIK